MSDQIIYGINPVLEALKADRSWLNKIIIAEGRHGPPLKSIQQLAREKGVPVQVRVKEVLRKLTGRENHQGVVGLLAGFPYSTFEDLLRVSRSKPGRVCILVLDGIEDPQNLGAIIRTAEATGAHGIIIRSRREVGLTAGAARSSAGAIEYIPVARVTNIAQAIEELKTHNVWVVGIDMAGTSDYRKVDFKSPTALVIGGEGKGLSELVRKRCDQIVFIPMKGKISSLNASVAAALVMYEVFTQRSKL